jgi:radical SAM superfamily enzyme YgiQ (UPF0313 family)
MRALLVHPTFPASFWSYESILALVGKKALMPPLGLLTVAALLPETWECRLVDCNVRPVTDADWAWAEIVLVSGMIVQKPDLLRIVGESRARQKPVVVGGPYATALPEEVRAAGADYLVVDEAEITLPLFLDALAHGATSGTFTAGGEKPEVTTTPAPRFDLLELEAYDSMPVQFSRGCPFACEFCDIIVLYGRRPRTKTPPQMLAELDALYQLGWRGAVFIVDDNFIGNRKAARELLREVAAWQRQRGDPFHFDTEATIDLAQDRELLDLMVECRFGAVFIGIETPDTDSLALTGKHQNLRAPMDEAIDTITRAGIRVMAGFIVGFDGEAAGADRRIVEFIERTAIPTAAVSMLQALPGTALTHRLEREGRLTCGGTATGNQTLLINFTPTRPAADVGMEVVNAYVTLYDPVTYLDRTWRYFLKLGTDRRNVSPAVETPAVRPDREARGSGVSWRAVRALLIVVWRQGVVRRSRWKFWHHAVSIACRNRRVWDHYLTLCAHNEHFLVFRDTIQRDVAAQIRARRDS